MSGGNSIVVELDVRVSSDAMKGTGTVTLPPLDESQIAEFRRWIERGARQATIPKVGGEKVGLNKGVLRRARIVSKVQSEVQLFKRDENDRVIPTGITVDDLPGPPEEGETTYTGYAELQEPDGTFRVIERRDDLQAAVNEAKHFAASSDYEFTRKDGSPTVTRQRYPVLAAGVEQTTKTTVIESKRRYINAVKDSLGI